MKGPIPEPEVQWRKPDGSVHSGSKVAHLESVAHSDAGAWNCTFSYDGKPYSERLDISVTGGSLPFAEHLQQGPQRLKTPCFAFRTRTCDSPGGQQGADLQRLWVLLPFVWQGRLSPGCVLNCPLAGAGGASTPPVPPPPLLLLGLSWWLWVVIGVGCLIVVVLMFFVIYLCKRIQRKKVSGQSSREALRIQISSGDYRDLNLLKKKKKKVIWDFFLL